MIGEKNLQILLQTMQPKLNDGEYVFCTLKSIDVLDFKAILFHFKEKEGITVVLEKQVADKLALDYTMIAAWITLSVHSALEAVGLTATFSNALAAENISCNVVAAYFHDHIFVDIKDATKAINILEKLSQMD